MNQYRTIEISITRVIAIILAIVVIVVVVSTRFWESGSGEPIETPTAEVAYTRTFEEASKEAAEDLLDYPNTGLAEDLLGFRDALNEDLYTDVFWEWISLDENITVLPGYGLAAGVPDPVIIGGPIILWQEENFRDVAYQYELKHGTDSNLLFGYGQVELRMWKVGDEWKMAKVLANTHVTWSGGVRSVQPDQVLMDKSLSQDATQIVREYAHEEITGLPTNERNTELYTENYFNRMEKIEVTLGDDALAKWAVPDYVVVGDPIVLWAIEGIYELAVIAQSLNEAGEIIEGGYIIVEFRLAQEDDEDWKVFANHVHKPRNEYEGIEGMVWP